MSMKLKFMQIFRRFKDWIKQSSSNFYNWVIFLVFLITVLLTIYLFNLYSNPAPIINFFNLFDKCSIPN